MEKVNPTLTPQKETPVPAQPPDAEFLDNFPPGFFKTVERMVDRNKEELKKLLDK